MILFSGACDKDKNLHFELKGQTAVDGTELEGDQAGDGGEDSPL